MTAVAALFKGKHFRMSPGLKLVICISLLEPMLREASTAVGVLAGTEIHNDGLTFRVFPNEETPYPMIR